MLPYQCQDSHALSETEIMWIVVTHLPNYNVLLSETVANEQASHGRPVVIHCPLRTHGDDCKLI